MKETPALSQSNPRRRPSGAPPSKETSHKQKKHSSHQHNTSPTPVGRAPRPQGPQSTESKPPSHKKSHPRSKSDPTTNSTSPTQPTTRPSQHQKSTLVDPTTPQLTATTPNKVRKETRRAVRQAAIRQDARQCHQQQKLTSVTAGTLTPRRNLKVKAT